MNQGSRSRIWDELFFRQRRSHSTIALALAVGTALIARHQDWESERVYSRRPVDCLETCPLRGKFPQNLEAHVVDS
jgi:hypothetical protein